MKVEIKRQSPNTAQDKDSQQTTQAPPLTSTEMQVTPPRVLVRWLPNSDFFTVTPCKNVLQTSGRTQDRCSVVHRPMDHFFYCG